MTQDFTPDNSLTTIEGEASVVENYSLSKRGLLEITEALGVGLEWGGQGLAADSSRNFIDGQNKFDQGNVVGGLVQGLTAWFIIRPASELIRKSAEKVAVAARELKPLAEVQRNSRAAAKFAIYHQTFTPTLPEERKIKLRQEALAAAIDVKNQGEEVLETLIKKKLLIHNTEEKTLALNVELDDETLESVRGLTSMALAVRATPVRKLVEEFLTANSVAGLALRRQQRTRQIFTNEKRRFAETGSAWSGSVLKTVEKIGEIQAGTDAAKRFGGDSPEENNFISKLLSLIRL